MNNNKIQKTPTVLCTLNHFVKIRLRYASMNNEVVKNSRIKHAQINNHFMKESELFKTLKLQ